jgi:protein SCO1/2
MQPPGNTLTNTRRYQLVGRVVSVDKAEKTLVVNGDEIPGYMMAMEMPYPVRDPKLLERVNPGDKINADLLIANDGSYLENIKVIAKGNGTASSPPK